MERKYGNFFRLFLRKCHGSILCYRPKSLSYFKRVWRHFLWKWCSSRDNLWRRYAEISWKTKRRKSYKPSSYCWCVGVFFLWLRTKVWTDFQPSSQKAFCSRCLICFLWPSDYWWQNRKSSLYYCTRKNKKSRCGNHRFGTGNQRMCLL